MCDITGNVPTDLHAIRIGSAQNINTIDLQTCGLTSPRGDINNLTALDASINQLTVNRLTITGGYTAPDCTWRHHPDSMNGSPTVQLNPQGYDYVDPNITPPTMLFNATTQNGKGTRLAFNAGDGSLRAGTASGTEWDARSINSTTLGAGGKTSGTPQSVIMGGLSSIVDGFNESSNNGVLSGACFMTEGTNSVSLGGTISFATVTRDDFFGSGVFNNVIELQYDPYPILAPSGKCGVVSGIFNQFNDVMTSAIFGGDQNALAGGGLSFIGSGVENFVANLRYIPHYCGILGGEKNNIGQGDASNFHCNIMGGYANVIDNYTIGPGFASDGGLWSSILGGEANRIGTLNGTKISPHTSILGGQSNTIHQNVSTSHILGGKTNTIGTVAGVAITNSMAVGQQATVEHSNSMVFSCGPVEKTTGPDQIRFAFDPNGLFIIKNLRTTLPVAAGELWNNGGVLTIV